MATQYDFSDADFCKGYCVARLLPDADPKVICGTRLPATDAYRAYQQGWATAIREVTALNLTLTTVAKLTNESETPNDN